MAEQLLPSIEVVYELPWPVAWVFASLILSLTLHEADEAYLRTASGLERLLRLQDHVRSVPQATSWTVEPTAQQPLAKPLVFNNFPRKCELP